MEHFIFSRRAWRADKNAFTDNVAALTRYMKVPRGQSPGKAHFRDADTFVAEVKARAVQHGILCYVHGFNTDQSDMLERMGHIENGLRAKGFQGVLVGYDWASDGNALKYPSDRRDAKDSARWLIEDGLGLFLDLPFPPKVHVLAHSMGALVTLRGLSDPGAYGPRPWKLDTLMWVSADIDRVWMGDLVWGGLVASKRARRVVNYWTNTDKILQLSRNTYNLGRDRLGYRGLPERAPADHEDLYCGAYFQSHVSKKGGNEPWTHRWYFQDETFHTDVAGVVMGIGQNGLGTRAPMANGDGQGLVKKSD